jgi:uncharacterized protein YecE (DUF72 family)
MQSASTRYLIGTGGWAYFKIPNKPSLSAYSQIFNFTEVNYTFYEYPEIARVERWRRMVPDDFVFSVRCHQDLSHKIGLKPIDEAYYVLNQMLVYCEILRAPFLVIETPAGQALNKGEVDEAENFLSSLSLSGVRLVWEIRAPMTPAVVELMREFNIVHCVDLSREEPSLKSDVAYSRLFGRGKLNIYQFTDEELMEIDQKTSQSSSKIAALSFHGLRMNTDANRFLTYKQTGEFVPVTSFTGVESVKAVLSEDAKFPTSKADLVAHQGWKVVDLTSNRRVHLSELLSMVSKPRFSSIDEVASAVEGVM